MAKRLLQGRYEILKKLGADPNQKTLLALDRQTQKLVVIKLLLFSADLAFQSINLFEREAKTLKSLDHTAIPRYLDFFDVSLPTGKGFALVQSYIEADSLEVQVSAGGTYSEDELKKIAQALLEVLDYLHSRCPRIIHRDIKPSNILLANRSSHQIGHLYLVDFGAVQTAQQTGTTRTVVGTYGYMPPEQFGERAVPASDLYSLGMTLVYLASGLHPADLPQENLRLCFEAQVSLSTPFIRWLQKLTEPSLENRIGSASEALQLLKRTAQTEAVVLAKEQTKTIAETVSKEQPFLRLSKPIDSKVALVKKSDLFQVFIPPQGFRWKLSPLIFLAILSNYFPLLAYWSAIRNMGIGGLILTLIFHLPGLWLGNNVLFTLFGTTLLRMEPDKIRTRRQLWGFAHRRCYNISRQHILRIERSNTANPKALGLWLGEHEAIHQINIWAGTQKINLGSLKFLFTRLLSEIELDWLAGEMSDWLNLPITYSRSTHWG